MREIAIVAYNQSDCVRRAGAANEVELIMPQLKAVYDQVGLRNAQDVDFVCSGSCDYLQGAAFAFVAGVDAQRGVREALPGREFENPERVLPRGLPVRRDDDERVTEVGAGLLHQVGEHLEAPGLEPVPAEFPLRPDADDGQLTVARILDGRGEGAVHARELQVGDVDLRRRRLRRRVDTAGVAGFRSAFPRQSRFA